MAADVVAELVCHDGGEFAVGQLVHGEAGDADDVAGGGDRVQAVAVLDPELVVTALDARAGGDLAPDRFEFGSFLRRGVAQMEQTAREGAFGGPVEDECAAQYPGDDHEDREVAEEEENMLTTRRLQRKFGR